ncbi:hypothetical protein AXK57_10015 [Tsukamurella pulmonis]|uniref:hypothetical protein n=1 Tax=Tsukamurella pulmonis TaxID=47312 RepID=UPI00079C484D|nr:hypothetical protein [Tsukamurella pulmonis]KXP10650.1 hypothetical protein AXK57_10015 [Tsukamurella pulmonis]RDH13005.1 hypothetical protein DVB88_04725 [Tsukamurella pulmonis]
MLLAALGATIIGFILLIVALVTANLWLAIACVVVSVVGVGLLLGDVLTYRRGDRDKADAERGRAWSPGDRSDDDRDEGDAATAAAAPAAQPESDPEELDDAAREAGTVGHEEFGRHDAPAEDDDARPTTQFVLGPLGGPTGWEHESPADTDDEATRGLFAPGKYDPDMTDQIPQIRIDQAWGSEWTPPQEPESESGSEHPDGK